MPLIPLQPDNGPYETGPATVPADDGGRLHEAWTWITTQVDAVPAWSWAIALGVLTILTVISLPILRAQAYKAGARTAGKRTPQDRKDRNLLIAVLTPAVLFWLAVLVGSARSLTQFGRDDLKWTGGWEYLVPFTLDGVAVAFGALAFRAVAKERNPDRAYRVVWMATAASAGINFFHEVGGSMLGAGYLAILSLFGMLIFHELLAQFEEGTAWIKRAYPKFGLRWFTWPSNTVCAWFAWRNHPLDEDIDASIKLAVEHLKDVRRRKAADRAGKVDAPAWWTTFTPWIRISGLGAALAEQRSETAAERALRENIAADVQRLLTEHDAVIRELRERHRQQTEALRSEAAEQINTLRAEHAAQVSRIREKNTTAPTGTPARASARTAPTASTAESRLSNDEAVELMLQTHPERDYEWGTREVSRLTGAGFGRVPKLIAAVREHHDRSAGTGDRNTPEDDAKERAS